jgi:hypothetical protein
MEHKDRDEEIENQREYCFSCYFNFQKKIKVMIGGGNCQIKKENFSSLSVVY